MDRIINNLKVTIKRVYFRFEDYLLFDPSVTFVQAGNPNGNGANDDISDISEQDDDQDEEEDPDDIESSLLEEHRFT